MYSNLDIPVLLFRCRVIKEIPHCNRLIVLFCFGFNLSASRETDSYVPTLHYSSISVLYAFFPIYEFKSPRGGLPFIWAPSDLHLFVFTVWFCAVTDKVVVRLHLLPLEINSIKKNRISLLARRSHPKPLLDEVCVVSCQVPKKSRHWSPITIPSF